MNLFLNVYKHQIERTKHNMFQTEKPHTTTNKPSQIIAQQARVKKADEIVLWQFRYGNVQIM